jgi:hypothetical protein
MIIPKLKNFEQTIAYDYAVCEIEQCIDEAKVLAMTDTRFVDFCKNHHKQYILEEK